MVDTPRAPCIMVHVGADQRPANRPEGVHTMAKWLDPIWLGKRATISLTCPDTEPTLVIRDGDGTYQTIHLAETNRGGSAKMADALAGLDILAAAVQAALLALAPDRFAQPGPDDPNDDPTDEPYRKNAPAAKWDPADGPAEGAATWQAHPMTENELRALAGDR